MAIMRTPDAPQYDRAREWLNENKPDLEGDDYDSALASVAADLAELDGDRFDGVTTEDLIATIAADRDDVATFYAREEYSRRTGQSWRKWAPVNPRTWADGVMWWNFSGA